jgi:hypothetical protein
MLCTFLFIRGKPSTAPSIELWGKTRPLGVEQLRLLTNTVCTADQSGSGLLVALWHSVNMPNNVTQRSQWAAAQGCLRAAVGSDTHKTRSTTLGIPFPRATIW